MRTKLLLIASAAVVLALPAIAQQQAATQAQPTPATTAAVPAATPTTSAAQSTAESGDETAVEEVSNASLQPPAPPVEYPGWARRDPWTVGSLSPKDAGVADDAWGGASGQFL